MPPQSIHEVVRLAERNYVIGYTRMGQYVTWSMNNVIEKIDAYLNGKHVSGETDSLGRPKPFFNIVTAAVNIWYRATDIDRKDIRFIPTKNTSVILAFVANVILQKWMDDNRFGQFLNAWGRSLARYGSSVPKFVEKKGKLIPTIVPWNRIICDQTDFDALPRMEKLYKTPAQLRDMATPGHPNYAGYDLKVVESLSTALVTRKTLKRLQKDNQPNFVELYEVHGELDTRLLEKNPDRKLKKGEQPKFVDQMHVVAWVQTGKDEYDDFTLYKGRERKNPYMITSLIEEDGRTLGIGAVEYLFDAQWMMNHTAKNMKDTLDLVSKVIFQTADTHYVGRNVLTAIETGAIMVHDDEKPLTRIAADNPSIVALQNFGTMWQNLAQELTSTPDALRGNTLPSGTSYSLGRQLGEQAGSLFEVMTENKGLCIEDMMMLFIIPFIKKQLKNTKQMAAILDDAGIQQIDSIYIPAEAVKRYNAQAKSDILSGEIPDSYDAETGEAGVKKELAPMGNQRFFVPDDFDKTTWDELFSDFEWDSIKVQVTNENDDKQIVLQTLSTVLQTIAQNPTILQNPNAAKVFTAIMRETGTMSPVELSTTAVAPLPRPQVQARENLTLKDMSPEQAQAVFKSIGIDVPAPTPSPADATQMTPANGAQSPPQQ